MSFMGGNCTSISKFYHACSALQESSRDKLVRGIEQLSEEEWGELFEYFMNL